MVEDGQSSKGAVIFFDMSPVEGKTTETVLVSSSRLVVSVTGVGRVVVVQRVAGGGAITLDTVVLEGRGQVEQVELEVGHAVQGWLVDTTLNLGLEVQGQVEVGAVNLVVNTQVRQVGG